MKRLIKIIVHRFWDALLALFSFVPLVRAVRETSGTQTPVTFSMWLAQRFSRTNRLAYWQIHRNSLVTSPERIRIGIETSPGIMPGCYIQGAGGIEIGDYTQIAPNVGIISANHDLHDNRLHVGKGPIVVGCYCWIGMGAIILPGVVLGEYTIVGAGAVVSRSFPDGYCVIAGNPARLVKTLERERCVFHRSQHEYIGYIPAAKFLRAPEKYMR